MKPSMVRAKPLLVVATRRTDYLRASRLARAAPEEVIVEERFDVSVERLKEPSTSCCLPGRVGGALGVAGHLFLDVNRVRHGITKGLVLKSSERMT